MSSSIISLVMSAGVAIVNILWEPNMNCLLLEESTIAIFACVRSIYSNKIDNIMDRQRWQAPLWPLARLWCSPGSSCTGKNLTLASQGSVLLQTQTHTPSLGHGEYAGCWFQMLSTHCTLCKRGNYIEESSVAAHQ